MHVQAIPSSELKALFRINLAGAHQQCPFREFESAFMALS